MDVEPIHNISALEQTYLLIQASWGLTRYAGKTIGNVEFIFDDGRQYSVALVLGENIRDWAIEDQTAVRTATSEMLKRLGEEQQKTLMS